VSANRAYYWLVAAQNLADVQATNFKWTEREALAMFLAPIAAFETREGAIAFAREHLPDGFLLHGHS